MAGRLEFPRLSWLQAATLFGLAVLAAGSAQFAWRAAVVPLPAAGPSLSNTPASRPILAQLQPDARPTSAMAALTARPLFSPSRRPPVEDQPVPEPETILQATPPSEVPPPQYSVDGVMVSGALRKTLLRRRPREAGEWLHQGDTTREGWTVRAISAAGVVLQQGSREITMPLRLRPHVQP
jgi:hypothetical protein